MANEAELVERARLGDRAAAGLLVRRYEGAVYAVALARVRNVDDAREVAQEALARALFSLPRLREAARFGAYAVRISMRLAAEHRRRRRTRALPELADPRPEPPAALDRRERRARLLAELERLPEEARRVFLLRHAEGFSYARIASLLEIPAGTVAWILHRTRRSLRASLRDLVEDEPR
ncbi:MAG: RNA polymerase sigma factor [Planctomycetota bacterium]